MAEISAHGPRERADVLVAWPIERIAVSFPPTLASTADVGVDLDVPRALAHAAGGRLKFLGRAKWENDENHEANLY